MPGTKTTVKSWKTRSRSANEMETYENRRTRPPAVSTAYESRRTVCAAHEQDLDDPVLLPNLLERLQRAIQMMPVMSRHVASAEHGALGRNAGRDERVGVDAVLFEQITPHHDRT